jgi:cellulose synthase/poly-beta-1,6-N-acetylglucosamine synthase-like glycosyltransferase
MDRPVDSWGAAAAGAPYAWAETPLTRPQRIGFLFLLLACTAGFIAMPLRTAEVLVGAAIILASGHMIFRAVLWLAGLWPMRQATPSRTDKELPVYSLIVPLYREANMAASLVSALGRLDYPADKLDILVALEADDAETAQAFGDISLPSHWRIVSVPDGFPRTKPRACNHALQLARGAFVAIYDAEDRPDPGQLRAAVATFDEGGEQLACIQARLFPDNARENVLTRLFALDFCQWFDAMLTGLQRLGFPVPLGGTSNHFRTGILRQAGAWDPWNVTEDADLGIRLGRLGYRVGTFDSTTWEEAPVTFSAWLPQRTRWSRGYVQTFFVHARSPRRIGLPALGVRGWIFLIFFVAASSVFALVNPLFWALATWHFATGSAPLVAVFGPVSGPLAAGLMFGGNLLCVLMTILGPLRRRAWSLMPWGLLAPIYWAMISTAAWRAVFMFVRDPFRWEKTPHGITRKSRP